jgi:hypothetical protein
MNQLQVGFFGSFFAWALSVPFMPSVGVKSTSGSGRAAR